MCRGIGRRRSLEGIEARRRREYFAAKDRCGKSLGAVGMGESSRRLSERLKDRPAFLGALSTMSQGKVVPVAGGVLIMRQNEVIGAVGVSGGTADEDEVCAIAGIQAAGLEFKV